MTQSAADQFLMGGGASAKFDSIGTVVAGTIAVQPEVRQQTDFDTGKPLFWDDGRPRNQLVVTLQTDQSDGPEDDGMRRLYVKGDMQKAVRDAVRQAGAPGLEVGGTLRVKYTGDGTPPRKGASAPKLYAAQYQRPTSSPSADAFLNQGAQPQPAQQPAQQPAGDAWGQPQPQQPAPVQQATPQAQRPW